MRDSTRELIEKKKAEVLLMELDVGDVEWQYRPIGGWFWMRVQVPAWNFEKYEYRVTPKPAECWIWVHADGTIGATTSWSKESCEHITTPGRAVLFREVTE